MPRERARVRPYEWNQIDTDFNGSVSVQKRTTHDLFEFIADENNGRNRPKGSFVTHKKVQLTPLLYDTSYSSFFGTRTSKNVAEPISAETAASYIDGYIDRQQLSELQDVLREQIYDAHARIFDEWSSINSLLEVSEIPALFGAAAETALRLGSTWRNRNFLEYQFGVLPLIGDLQVLYNNVRAVFTRLGSMRAMSGQPRRFSQSRRINLDRPFGSLGQSYATISHSEFTSSTMRGTGMLTVTYPGLSDIQQDLADTLDLLGVHPDLSTVWDAIPFSWLIDWIIPVGEHLERLHSRGWSNPNVSVDGGLSLKIGANLVFLYDEAGDWSGYPQLSGAYQSRGRYSLYERQPLTTLLAQSEIPPVRLPAISLTRAAVLGSLGQSFVRYR